MRALMSSVVWRYLAILIQFFVVITVTRSLPLDVAGRYFSLFGFVAVSFTLSGFGIPDGLVKELSRLRAGSASNGFAKLWRRGVLLASGLNMALAFGLGFVGLMLAQVPQSMWPLVSLWWLGYAATFLFAQLLVGQGRPVLATFCAYSSINISYVFTLIPYLLFARDPQLGMVILVAAGGALAASVATAVIAVKRGVVWPENAPSEDDKPAAPRGLWAVMRDGVPMMVARFMQASLPWTPVWLLGLFHSPEAAALYAAASRLTVAVTSVVAALRFSARGEIVALNEAGDFSQIVRLNHRASLMSAVPVVLGLAFLLVYGDWIVPLILGDAYALAVPVLLVLVFGAMAESFGGLSDEILKMTGRTRVVMLSLFAAIGVQFTLGAGLALQGATDIAFATVAAFWVQYLWQVYWLSSQTPIRILPFGRPVEAAEKRHEWD